VLLAIIAGDADTFSAQMVANRGEVTHIGELSARPRGRESALFPLPTREGEPAPKVGDDDEPAPSDWLPRTAEGHIRPPHSPTPVPVLTVSGAAGAKAIS
jgi:hypothetical protein